MAEQKKKSPKSKSKSAAASKAVKADTPAPKSEHLISDPVEQKAPDASADYEVVSPPPTVDPRRGSGLLVVVLLMTVIGFGTYATWPLWSPYVAPQFPALEYKPAVDPRVSGLAGRLEALEAQNSGSVEQSAIIKDMERERARLQNEVGQLLQRLENIEKTIDGVKNMVIATGVKTPSGETKRAIEEITARLSELEQTGKGYGTLNQRLDQLENETATGSGEAVKHVAKAKTEINSMIGKLEDRLNSLEATGVESSNSQATASAIILAVSQLRKTAVSGQPFDKDVDALMALAKDHPDMQAALLVLTQNAKTGTQTIDQLRNIFSDHASDIVRADNIDAGNSWYESAKKRVLSLVSIRKLGGSSDEVTVDSLVVLTEDHLRKGDIAAAVKIAEELETVSLPAFKAAQPWLDAAKSRLKTERAVASLHVYAVALVASSKG